MWGGKPRSFPESVFPMFDQMTFCPRLLGIICCTIASWRQAVQAPAHFLCHSRTLEYAKLQIAPTRSKMIQRIPKRRRYRRLSWTETQRSECCETWKACLCLRPSPLSLPMRHQVFFHIRHMFFHVLPPIWQQVAHHVACNRFWQPMYACFTGCAMSLETHLLHFCTCRKSFWRILTCSCTCCTCQALYWGFQQSTAAVFYSNWTTWDASQAFFDSEMARERLNRYMDGIWRQYELVVLSGGCVQTRSWLSVQPRNVDEPWWTDEPSRVWRENIELQICKEVQWCSVKVIQSSHVAFCPSSPSSRSFVLWDQVTVAGAENASCHRTRTSETSFVVNPWQQLGTSSHILAHNADICKIDQNCANLYIRCLFRHIRVASCSNVLSIVISSDYMPVCCKLVETCAGFYACTCLSIFMYTSIIWLLQCLQVFGLFYGDVSACVTAPRPPRYHDLPSKRAPCVGRCARKLGDLRTSGAANHGAPWISTSNMFPATPWFAHTQTTHPKQYYILVTRGSMKSQAIRSDFDFKFSWFRVLI